MVIFKVKHCLRFVPLSLPQIFILVFNLQACFKLNCRQKSTLLIKRDEYCSLEGDQAGVLAVVLFSELLPALCSASHALIPTTATCTLEFRQQEHVEGTALLPNAYTLHGDKTLT